MRSRGAGARPSPVVLCSQVLFSLSLFFLCPRKTSCDGAFLWSCYCWSSWGAPKQESLFVFLVTLTVWCDIFPFGQKLGNKYNTAKTEQEEKGRIARLPCCWRLGLVFYFSPAVVWRRRRKKSALVEVETCVCIRGSRRHNQLRWARCGAPRVPGGGRGRAEAPSRPGPALRRVLPACLPHFPSLPLARSLSSARSRWDLTVRSPSLPLRAGTAECLPSAASAHPPPHFPKYKEVEHQGPR